MISAKAPVSIEPLLRVSETTKMHTYVRGYCERAALADSKPGEVIRFVASTAGVKRDGLAIDQDGWQLDDFKANPAFLWVHDYMGNRPPIGRVENVFVEDGNLKADVLFDQGDDFARDVERKYRQGFLSAVSVGWDIVEMQPSKNPELRGTVTKATLLDLSAVPIPGDPGALMERQKRALSDFGRDLLKLVEPEIDDPKPDTHRAAISPHTTDKAPEEAPWDGPGVMAQVEGREQLRRVCAWVDSEADQDAKNAYKLPHHHADGDVVWRGVAAAMSRLMQGGTSIPDSDRRGVYAHLARHYKQFDREPPEFRTNDDLAALGPAEMRGLFLEGEPDLFPDFFAWADSRAGAVLSARNRDSLEQAISLISGVLASAKKEAKTDDDSADDAERGADNPLALIAKTMEIAA